MSQRVHLRIYANGDFDAEHTAIFFSRIVDAYKSLLILDKIIVAGGDGKHIRLKVSPIAPFIESAKDRLRLVSVEFHSPGFWEFFGKVNPLEVLREYLNDRHQRLKDVTYKNDSEKRTLTLKNERLSIENSVLRLKFVNSLITTCRKAGLSEHEIRALVTEYALAPLLRLDALAEQGLITYAEMREDEKEEETELV